MFHTPYVYGRMRLYEDKGIDRLKAFFGEAGINPADYTEFYANVNYSVRKKFIGHFEKMLTNETVDKETGGIKQTSQSVARRHNLENITKGNVLQRNFGTIGKGKSNYNLSEVT